MKVNLRNFAGVSKEVKVGFSFTMLFFGLFVPLFRGDFKWTILALIIAIVTCGFGWLVMPFIYNKMYIKDLLERGYLPVTDEDRSILQGKGIIAA